MLHSDPKMLIEQLKFEELVTYFLIRERSYMSSLHERPGHEISIFVIYF